MKQFRSIEKIDTAILYTLELTSSISVLLLAFGLIASMANVLTQGSVLTDNLVMQRVWAWHRRELKPALAEKRACMSSRGSGSKFVQESTDLMRLQTPFSRTAIQK
ncbi:MAG TPA: hypothetical protein VGL94_14345, partial [Ktedonobacteraceae bacterium]